MDKERLRTFYPTLQDYELEKAGEYLRAYFALAFEIASQDRSGEVDRSNRIVTMEERSKGSLKIKTFEHG